MLKIKEFREKKGLTQQELANLVGVDRVSIARYESENRSPNHEILLKLSLELDTTPNDLLGFD